MTASSKLALWSFLVVAVGVGGRPARADGPPRLQTISGVVCQPADGNGIADLVRTQYGIHNLNINATRSVYCPLPLSFRGAGINAIVALLLNLVILLGMMA